MKNNDIHPECFSSQQLLFAYRFVLSNRSRLNYYPRFFMDFQLRLLIFLSSFYLLLPWPLLHFFFSLLKEHIFIFFFCFYSRRADGTK